MTSLNKLAGFLKEAEKLLSVERSFSIWQRVHNPLTKQRHSDQMDAQRENVRLEMLKLSTKERVAALSLYYPQPRY